MNKALQFTKDVKELLDEFICDYSEKTMKAFGDRLLQLASDYAKEITNEYINGSTKATIPFVCAILKFCESSVWDILDEEGRYISDSFFDSLKLTNIRFVKMGIANDRKKEE